MDCLKLGYVTICIAVVCALWLCSQQVFTNFTNTTALTSYSLEIDNRSKHLENQPDIRIVGPDLSNTITNVESVTDVNIPGTSMDMLRDGRTGLPTGDLDASFKETNPSIPNGTDASSANSKNPTKANDVKTIMYWTTIYGMNWEKYWGSAEEIFKHCEFSRCRATADKLQLKQASLLLFFHRDPPNFPDARYPGQLYMHYTKEPPDSKDQRYLDEYEDILNLTGNYRSTADVHVQPMRRIYRPLPEPKHGIYEPKIPFKDRTKYVAWMVSRCLVDSRRHDYVNELKKYIEVDIFGACGNARCTKSLVHCYGNLGLKYKFYLAFENSICPGYTTEKPIYAMEAEMVPVVLGMPDYKNSKTIPPHSVIDVRDFKSPKDLAQYLNQMSEEEYNRYFQWRMTHEKIGTESVLCRLCKILHSEKYKKGEQFVPSYKAYGGYRRWWQDGCVNDLIKRMRRDGGW